MENSLETSTSSYTMNELCCRCKIKNISYTIVEKGIHYNYCWECGCRVSGIYQRESAPCYKLSEFLPKPGVIVTKHHESTWDGDQSNYDECVLLGESIGRDGMVKCSLGFILASELTWPARVCKKRHNY